MMRLTLLRTAVFVFAGTLLAGWAAAERPPIRVNGVGACPPMSAGYVVLLETDRPALVLSGSTFPGASKLGVAGEAGVSGSVEGYGAATVPAAPGTEVWALADPALEDAPSGCLGFDKDRFTWASDLLTYVRYLARELFAALHVRDPSRTSLTVRQRSVHLEVIRPGRDRAVLEGVEGGMLGFGAPGDPERWFFLPVVVDPEAPSVLVRILRNREAAFAEKATTPVGWALLEGSETTLSDTTPAFQLRLMGLGG